MAQPMRRVHTIGGETVDVPLTAEDRLPALTATEESERASESALNAIRAAEATQGRALREALLSILDPGSIDAATVTEATARLRAVETTVRAERPKVVR